MKELGTSPDPLPPTEEHNPLSEDIDTKSSLEIVEIINREDARAAKAVFEAKASIAAAIDWAAQAFQKGGRLIYAGAGTSGRLGQLDASEAPPTFGVRPDLIQALVAGGTKALTRSVEGAEDDIDAGVKDLASRLPTDRDVVIGISAASTTPYVRGVLAEARRVGAKAILVTCNPLPEKVDFADLVITAVTGPEILTGSTRMKAGTATKMILNMISTGAMIRTGRTYGNLMVDLSCSNRKLIARGIRIIQNVTQFPEKKARTLLRSAEFHVKTALVMGIFGVDFAEAEKRLRQSGGFLRRLFDHNHRRNPKIGAIFFDMDGTILQYDLPNGFSTWAALGWAFGIFAEMEEWVDRYLAKEISYEDIWKTCAERIRGRTFQEIQDILFPSAGTPPYSRGFPESVRTLRGHYPMGIVSSGISVVSDEIRKKLNLDFEISNHLGVHQGKFDGSYEIRVPFNRKLDVVKAKADQLKIPLKQICFIGDSPNDVEVLQAVGFPIAYRPKTEKVAAAAKRNVIGDFLQLPPLLETF